MKRFLTDLNKWIRKIHRWMVIPVVLILLISLSLRGSSAAQTIQRIQQISIIFMVITGVYLYLYRQWSIWQRNKRTS